MEIVLILLIFAAFIVFVWQWIDNRIITKKLDRMQAERQKREQNGLQAETEAVSDDAEELYLALKNMNDRKIIKKCNTDPAFCSVCGGRIDTGKTDMFALPFLSSTHLVCRHCLVELYRQIQDAMMEGFECVPSKRRKPKLHQYRLISSVLNGE